ncbi:hypothetical protein Psi02_44520 [Planotetraspora silvatica]|uniref:histidine kinase n=1 Tax=Planotetraspora silvatica TaxID=234614 RepID=A0A8J3ULI0_9ACTN|nr:HAMP domain-containing sensor histidine kinase [Planotetraspora silvatica]GII48028.1 hypothetical protein Psi02_44520 [Planotetraspora silvatica]
MTPELSRRPVDAPEGAGHDRIAKRLPDVAGVATRRASRTGVLRRRPRSIRRHYTIMFATVSFLFLTTLGATLDMLIEKNMEVEAIGTTEQVATEWSARVRAGHIPRIIPSTDHVSLIQVLDPRGRVVDASRAAITRPLSGFHPSSSDRVQSFTQQSQGGEPLVLTAVRVTPARNSSYVYAGLLESYLLADHRLEIDTAACGAFLLLLETWLAWSLGGQILRPVDSMRASLSKITSPRPGLRVPVPPGQDEIALLARTVNETLARLGTAAERQRRFASDVSHELRTPLTGLRARLEEAVLYPGDTDPHKAIRGALSTADHLQEVMEDLLVLGRLHAAGPSPGAPIDLGALVAEMAAIRTGTIPVRVQIVPGVRVRSSRVQLVRIMENLLANARRHADSRIDVTVAATGRWAVMTLADDGAGIAPHDRERVFERFTRLDEARSRDPEGSGLGLAISREIAEAHGGTLRLEDSPGGARFVLRLPLLQDRDPD